MLNEFQSESLESPLEPSILSLGESAIQAISLNTTTADLNDSVDYHSFFDISVSSKKPSNQHNLTQNSIKAPLKSPCPGCLIL